jgi:DNA-binding MarR family transcriptional regulator
MARVAQFDTQMLEDWFKPTEAMVYGYLWWCSWKSKRWELEPSISLMSKTLWLCNRTIIRAIQKLEKRELIEVSRSYQEKNVYVLVDMSKYPPCNNFDYNLMMNQKKKLKVW